MTRLLTTGYETGDINEAGVSTIGSGTLTVVNSTPTPRAGSYCLKVASSGTSLTTTCKTYTLPAAKNDLYVRFAVFMHPASSTTEVVIAGVQDASGNGSSCLTWDPSSGVVRARQQVTIGGTLLGTGSTPFPADTWHVLEWRTQITNATTGTTTVWLDGNQIITFSGDNTGSAAGTTVQFLVLGSCSGTIGSATGWYAGFDDIAVNDTSGTVNTGRPLDGRVILLAPNGAGSSTQLTRGGTDTGANWSQVSEVPPSMAQYVGSPTVAQRDLYALANLPVAVQSINVVEVLALAQNSDAGGGSVGLTVKSGATVNEATAIGLGTTAAYVTSRWEIDPNGSVAWSAAAVDALEIGVTIR